MQFFTVLMLLIAGLMCGLTGMLLLTKRQPEVQHFTQSNLSPVELKKISAMMHASGLLIFTGIPLANFLACYFLWLRHRHKSSELERHGREVICQQITVYMYAMMCLFMALIAVGVFGLLLLLAYHLVVTLVAVSMALQGNLFRYPANIAIIDRQL